MIRASTHAGDLYAAYTYVVEHAMHCNARYCIHIGRLPSIGPVSVHNKPRIDTRLHNNRVCTNNMTMQTELCELRV